MMIDTDILLAFGATYKTIVEGETIFREGSEGRFYYQLESGSIRWVNITDDGKEFIQSIIGPGESFGEMPLFDNRPHAASAIANKDCVLMRLPKTTFLQLLREYPELHFKFSQLLSERLRFKFTFLRELANANPEHTILTLFDHFKESKQNICLNCNKVQLTRQQIADMTGMRVETVIRTIKHMQGKGTLSITRGKVYC